VKIMRTVWRFSCCVLGLLACEGSGAAQTVVEYGATGSAAATATTATKGVGSSIGGMFDSLGKTLNQAQDQVQNAKPAANTHSATTAPAKPKLDAMKGAAAPRSSYEDAIDIQKGMSCEEVTQRFGPPAMAFAAGEDAKTISYVSKGGGVQVECQDGKVTSVEKPVKKSDSSE
jgi:hypothetical protein